VVDRRTRPVLQQVPDDVQHVPLVPRLKLSLNQFRTDAGENISPGKSNSWCI
jgi:hypothetical protein